ncbi:cation diffusion facilitator CzcD-associated flavoprotein CzcO [Marmoricola sp. URHA0025 HA25]
MASKPTQPPVVVIGAGPIGLAAAAQAQARGLAVVVLESGTSAGTSVRSWGHLRLFSAWSELIDPAAAALLGASGWLAPDAAAYPTGAQWVDEYLQPLADALAATDEVEVLHSSRVTGVARSGRDRLVDDGRDHEPFTIHVDGPSGPRLLAATAVIDASGTWTGPNPLGGDGLPALGEAEHADRIFHGIPDFRDAQTAARYAGKHVVVAGTGASAHNVLVGLAAVGAADPGTRVSWLVRRTAPETAFGGGEDDQLAERGALGLRAKAVASSSLVQARTGFRTEAVANGPHGRLRIGSLDGQVVEDVDEVIVVTGFRPDLSFLTEVRLDLDPVLSAPRRLAPLVDPNVHSCGTVSPHGAAELAQPEPGLYLAGMKSYGRATSFLALTGFEQVRSVVAAIDGDHDAAARVELVLPESGVCGGSGLFDAAGTTGPGCCAPVASQLLTIGTRDGD